MAGERTVKILALAYACEPTKGSEPGVGWMWSRLLARLGDTTVLTRSNNRQLIEAALSSTPEAKHLRFEYVDLPKWARFWKRGQHGVRLYYLLWQLAALRRARRLHRAEAFDLVWHVTMANYWLGSVGGLVGPPFVFGPTTGGVRACLNVRIVGPRGLLYEVVRAVTRAANHVANPLVSSAWRRASLILVSNPDTRDRLPEGYRHKTEIFPNVLLEKASTPDRRKRDEPRVALFAGRLLAWKGVALAIRAVARLPGWKLIVCGEGPDEARLRRLSRRLGVAKRVEFRGWVPRDELQVMMRREASVFVFPSLHDDAGWVVAEATANGLPVVCLDRGGPASIAGVAGVRTGGLSHTVQALAGAIEHAGEGTAVRAWDIDSRQRQLVCVLRRATHRAGKPGERDIRRDQSIPGP
jgi:glycosyltransferase involved in cell wall biosynthesis